MLRMPTGRTMRVLTSTIALIAIQAFASGSDTDRFPSNEDMRHYGAMDDPQLAPDGNRALVQVKDPTSDGGRGHLWLIDIRGGPPRQLTYSAQADDQGESAGRWMPDGQSILFLARRGDHGSLFRLPLRGGEAQLFDLSLDVAFYEISPDGKRIALAVRDLETPAEQRSRQSRADVLWVDHDLHGTELYLLDLLTSKATRVPVPPEVKEFAWSADAAQLVVRCEALNLVGALAWSESVWVVSSSDQSHPQSLADLPTGIESIVWSTDGQSLLFRAQARREAPPGYEDLYGYHLATKMLRDFTDGLEGSLASYPSYQAPIAFGADGAIHPVQKGLEVVVARWQHAGRAPEFLPLPLHAVSRVGTNASRNGWLFLGSSSSRPPTLLFASRLTDAPRVLSTPALAPNYLTSAGAKRISWSNEGLTLEGLLYLPPSASDAHPVPLVVEAHGGPTYQFMDIYDPYVDFLLGQGWAVLRPNPRGGTGRGAAFAAANKNDLGGGDYRDIMSGVDFVLKTAPLDARRLAFIGYSYGGEMAAFVEGKTTRFKAIVSGGPVVDQFSEYGTQTAYDSSSDRWFFGKPWEQFADVWRQSPLSTVGTAKTPLLLLQGQSDSVDPQGQAYEMYRALRQVGVPVELVIYPREQHLTLMSGIYGQPSGEPWHGFDARARTVTFISRAFGAPYAQDGTRSP